MPPSPMPQHRQSCYWRKLNLVGAIDFLPLVEQPVERIVEMAIVGFLDGD